MPAFDRNEVVSKTLGGFRDFNCRFGNWLGTGMENSKGRSGVGSVTCAVSTLNYLSCGGLGGVEFQVSGRLVRTHARPMLHQNEQSAEAYARMAPKFSSRGIISPSREHHGNMEKHEPC
jgi:hypothetical protein